jgi:hypothetical protein
MHKARHHQAEQHIEHEIPPANVQAFSRGALCVARDGQEFLAEKEVGNTDGDEQSERFHYFRWRHHQQFTDQRALQFLLAAGAFAQGED